MSRVRSGHYSGLISQEHRRFKSVTRNQTIRSVAQSGSAPALGAGGPRFESLYADHFNADMAQLVAHIIGNDEVPSSNLGISTKGNII